MFWQPVAAQNSDGKTIVRTGRTTSSGSAEVGTAPHPYWHAAISGDGIELRDIRPHAFPSRKGREWLAVYRRRLSPDKPR